MKYEQYLAMRYLAKKLYPNIEDKEMVSSRDVMCLHCGKFDGKDKETEKEEIFFEKIKYCTDDVWVLKIERHCSRCGSYRKEQILLNFITRGKDYGMGYYDGDIEEEYKLDAKCSNCGSNLYHVHTGAMGSGSIGVFCKKCNKTQHICHYD